MPRKPPKKSGKGGSDEPSGEVSLLHLYPAVGIEEIPKADNDHRTGYANPNAKPPETRKLFLKAYELTFGNVSASCEFAGIKRPTFYRWMKSKTAVNKRFQARIALIKPDDYLVDIAEAHTVEQIVKEKNWQAMKHVLETKGRNRRWARELPAPDITPEDRMILDALKRKIYDRASQKGCSYAEEVKNYLNLFGDDLKNEIREELVSEMVN